MRGTRVQSDAEHSARGKYNSNFKVWKRPLVRIGDRREGQSGGVSKGFGVFSFQFCHYFVILGNFYWCNLRF